MKRIILSALIVIIMASIGAGFYVLDSRAETSGFDISASAPADGGSVILSWLNPSLEYKAIKIFQSNNAAVRGQLITTIENLVANEKLTFSVQNIIPKSANFFTLVAEKSSGHEVVLGKITHLATSYPSSIAVAATDADARPVVRVFSGEGVLLAEIYPYEIEYKGAVEISRADLDGDGSQEILVAPQNNSSTVRIFRENGQLIGSVEVYEKGFNSGVTVEPVKFYNSGLAVKFFAVAPRAGQSDKKPKAHPVKIYRYDASNPSALAPIEQFIPFEGHLGGLSLAAGDFTGDGYDELAVTPVGAMAEVRVYHLCVEDMPECVNKYGIQRVSSPEGVFDKIFPFGRTEIQNIKIKAFDFDRDGKEEMIIYPMSGRTTVIKIFSCQVMEGYRCLAKQLDAKQVYGDKFKGGVNVMAFEGKRNEDRYLLVSPQKTGGPHLKLYRWDKTSLKQTSEFFAYDAKFTGGVLSAAYKFEGQDNVSVVTVPQSSGGAHVKQFDYLTGTMIKQFFAFDGDKNIISIR